MKQTIQQYLEASCGLGKYYPSELSLLKKLQGSKLPRWGGFQVSELIETIKERLELLAISYEGTVG